MPADVLQRTGETPSAGSVEILDPLPATPNRLGEGIAPIATDDLHAGGVFGNSSKPEVLRRVPLGGTMRLTIALKIFGIAVGLLVLMGAAALLSLRMTHTVDSQLVILDQNYFPAYVSLADANIRSVEESAFIRRLIIAYLESPRDDSKIADLQKRAAAAGKASDDDLAEARRHINEQIADPLDFNDNVELARLDTRVEFVQEIRRDYETDYDKLLAAAGASSAGADDRSPEVARYLSELDRIRDDIDRRLDGVRTEMRQLAGNAIVGTRDYQMRVVEIGLVLLVIAGLLGITVAGAVTLGLVRPMRRLLAGTAAVEQGLLDTVVRVTSKDEVGRLTHAFNNMIAELRKKAQIRETFGKYVDPRIVAGLIDRPELTGPQGSRREMTILFCDMQGFTGFSEGMTPTGLVNVLNRYLTVISEPVRNNRGIIDKYIGDAVMAFWGPPFTGAEEQARLACLAALEQLAALPSFQAELPDLMGVRRGLPRVAIRVGIATGEVVVGSIGSEQTRSYTVIGDTVNFASRLEGAGKAYGTRVLISEATQRLAAEAIETREIDTVLVVGKTEPERIFELLGRKGEVANEKLELRDAFEAALVAYRKQAWDEAETGFKNCLVLAPEDKPSEVFLTRIEHFREHPRGANWIGAWALETK
jgi:class 3 adenylate cyclase